MSIRATTAVWDHSQHEGSKLLLMLALADFANDNAESWPALATLAKMVRLSDRQVRSLLRELEASREIETQAGAGPHGTNIYRIVLPDAVGKSTSAPQKPASPPRKPTSANPSVVIVFPSSSNGDKSIENQQQQEDRGKPATGGGNSTSPPDEVNDLLATWATYGVAGSWLWATASLILERPDHNAEINDILDYYEAWNQYAADFKKLTPGWIAAQLKDLAALPVDAPAPLRWMDHAPPASAKPEYWRKYTAATDPNDFDAIKRAYGGYARHQDEADEWRRQQEQDNA